MASGNLLYESNSATIFAKMYSTDNKSLYLLCVSCECSFLLKQVMIENYKSKVCRSDSVWDM